MYRSNLANINELRKIAKIGNQIKLHY